MRTDLRPRFTYKMDGRSAFCYEIVTIFSDFEEVKIILTVKSGGLTCLQVAYGGGRLHVLSIVENILNKQLRMANRGWSSSFSVVRRLTALHFNKLSRYGLLHRDSHWDRTS